MDTYKIHRFAMHCPQLGDGAYEALVKDIKRNGVHEPILLFEGKILDGRHRYKACRELGIDAPLKVFKGTSQEAAERSISANLSRRHLSKSQAAMFLVRAGVVGRPKRFGQRAIYPKGK